MFNKIFEAFPTPEILEVPFAGLAISDTAVRCIQFGKRQGHLYIKKYSEKKLEPGLILSGEINNREAFISILQNLKKELNLGFVKVSLPEEKAYLFTAKIPIVKPAEVRSAVESKIEENVPLNPAELLYDYKLIDHREKGHLDVIVSNIPATIIENYVDIVNSSGLGLLSLEIESQAVARALIPQNDDGTSLMVHFGPEKVGLYVVNCRIVRFTSTLPIKGEVDSNLEFLLHEIKKLFIYWHTLKENIDRTDKKISEIIVSGENVGEDVVRYLSTENSTPVVLGNVWTNAFNVDDVVPEISFSDSLRYSVAVGLALPTDTLI